MPPAWLSWLLGRTPHQEPQEPAPGAVQLYRDNADTAAGCEFCATLQLRTPTFVLRHHGDHHRGPPESAPRYGGLGDGIWLPRPRPCRELGIPGDWPDETPEHEHASDIGPIKPSAYLPFLLAFREVVEGESTTKAKVAAIRQLRSAHLPIWKRLLRAYPDFPHSFFNAELARLPGIGPKTARNLYQAGLTTVGEVLGATDERLLAVDGVGPKLVKRIRAPGVSDSSRLAAPNS